MGGVGGPDTTFQNKKLKKKGGGGGANTCGVSTNSRLWAGCNFILSAYADTQQNPIFC